MRISDWSSDVCSSDLLTVSPVPLIATYEPEHVLCATTYSKSVLRVAATMLARGREWVDYYPSYEIITGSYNRSVYYESDYRGVNSLDRKSTRLNSSH